MRPGPRWCRRKNLRLRSAAKIWWWSTAATPWPIRRPGQRRSQPATCRAPCTRTWIATCREPRRPGPAAAATRGRRCAASVRAWATGGLPRITRWWPTTAATARSRRGCGSCCARWGMPTWRCSTAAGRDGVRWACRWKLPWLRLRRPITAAASTKPGCWMRAACSRSWRPAACCWTRAAPRGSAASPSPSTRCPGTCPARSTGPTPKTSATTAVSALPTSCATTSSA